MSQFSPMNDLERTKAVNKDISQKFKMFQQSQNPDFQQKTQPKNPSANFKENIQQLSMNGSSEKQKIQPVFDPPAPIQPRYRREAQLLQDGEIQLQGDRLLTETYVKDRTLLEAQNKTKIVYKQQPQPKSGFKIKMRSPGNKSSFGDEQNLTNLFQSEQILFENVSGGAQTLEDSTPLKAQLRLEKIQLIEREIELLILKKQHAIQNMDVKLKEMELTMEMQ